MPVTIQGNSAGSGTAIVQNGATASNITVTLPTATTTLVGTDTTQTLTNKTIQGGTLGVATAVSTTSGTVAEITGIPSWAKRLTVTCLQVSMSGTDNLLVQLGTSSGYVTTGYASSSGGTSSTAGFIVGSATAARELTGHMVLTLISGTTWVGSHSMAQDAAGGNNITGAGRGVLGIVPDRIRLTPTGVTTFDLGSFSVMWEG